MLCYLGNILPSSIIAILIIYCLKGINFSHFYAFGPQLTGIIIVSVLHIWKRNNLFSIGVGTVCYMLLLRI